MWKIAQIKPSLAYFPVMQYCSVDYDPVGLQEHSAGLLQEEHGGGEHHYGAAGAGGHCGVRITTFLFLRVHILVLHTQVAQFYVF